LEANFGSGYDIATLGHILHSEGEDRSRKLLKKTFRALKSGGTIAIAEWLVNDERTKPLPSLMFAVQMLVNTEKGEHLQLQRNQKLARRSGFQKSTKTGSAGTFTANSGDKAVAVDQLDWPFCSNGLLIRAVTCSHIVDERGKNEIAYQDQGPDYKKN
jgi:O-methyltransferase domain